MRSRRASPGSTLGGLARLLEAGLAGRAADTVGPSGYRAVIAIRAAALAATAPLALAAYKLAGVAAVPAAVALALLVAAAAVPLYRSLVGSGVDRELPAVLAYLIPFSYSTAAVAEVLSALAARDSGFRWFRVEAARLRHYMESGLDPLGALERLASTTPSRRLREALSTLTTAVKTGAPRPFISQRLLDHAMESIRASWTSYTALARLMAESSAALAVLAAALAPAAALASMDASWLAAATVLPLAAAAALVSLKPPLGTHPQGPAAYAPIAVGAAASAAAVAGVDPARIALALLPAAVAVEAAALKAGRKWRGSWRTLMAALARARAGALDPGDLAKAEYAAPGVARALARASRIAGRSGLPAALDALSNALLEAARLARSAATQAAVMALVSAAAAAVGAYSVSVMGEIASGGPLLDPAALSAMPRVMAALAVAAPLPASAAARPHAPSLAPSLAALAAVALITGSP